MKIRSAKKIFAAVLMAALFCSQPADSLNIAKSDYSKTGEKFSDWAKKQQENFQSTMEQISESQFATFIGDGIKSAKEGIKFAKDTYQGALDTYNSVKDATVGSKEYKIAMLSKQIAEESKTLADLQKEKESKLADIKADKELERKTLEEKMTQAQQNFQVGTAIYQNELDAKATDGQDDALQQEVEDFKANNNAELASMEQEIQQLTITAEEESKAVEDEFSGKIIEQAQKISSLTQELNDLIGLNKAKDDAPVDPEQEIKQAMDDLSFKENAAISLKDRVDKAKSRQSVTSEAVQNASSSAIEQIASIEDIQNEQENISDTSETLNGKSESIQIAIQNTITQMETLQAYLIMELKALEAETVLILATSDFRTGEPKTMIDICDYEDEEKGGLSLTDMVTKGKETIGNVKDKVNNISEKYQEAKEMGEQIGEAGKALKEAGGNVGDVVGMMGIM